MHIVKLRVSLKRHKLNCPSETYSWLMVTALIQIHSQWWLSPWLKSLPVKLDEATTWYEPLDIRYEATTTDAQIQGPWSGLSNQYFLPKSTCRCTRLHNAKSHAVIDFLWSLKTFFWHDFVIHPPSKIRMRENSEDKLGERVHFCFQLERWFLFLWSMIRVGGLQAMHETNLEALIGHMLSVFWKCGTFN